MNDSSQKIIQIVMSESEGVAVFEIDQKRIHYKNEVEVVEGQAPVPKIIISNQLERTHSFFSKVTEIRVGTQLLRIRDIFTFEPEHAPQGDSTHQAPQTLHGKFQRDRKNIVKNIAKAFRAWLQFSQHKRPQLVQAREEVDQLFAKAKFNNRLILELANESLKPFFMQFLKFKAEEWVEESKINDKMAHLEAIRTYLHICENEDAFTKFRVLRSRQAKSN